MGRIASVALAVALVGSASAQTILTNDHASDPEIFAAYCSGALTTQIEKVPSNDKWPAEAAVRSQLSRFHGYMVARGLLSGHRGPAAVTGVNYAAERGRDDLIACNSAKKQCVDSCLRSATLGTPEFGGCLDACSAKIQQCTSTDRCFDPNQQMPF